MFSYDFWHLRRVSDHVYAQRDYGMVVTAPVCWCKSFINTHQVCVKSSFLLFVNRLYMQNGPLSLKAFYEWVAHLNAMDLFPNLKTPMSALLHTQCFVRNGRLSLPLHIKGQFSSSRATSSVLVKPPFTWAAKERTIRHKVTKVSSLLSCMIVAVVLLTLRTA